MLQKLPLNDLRQGRDAKDSRVFHLSAAAYRAVKLQRNEKKAKIACTKGTILGAEVDGIRGIVSAPRDRVACLALLTAYTARQGCATPEMLDSLLGSWIHVLFFRRPLFSIMDHLFKESCPRRRCEVFRLSPKSRNELFLLSVLGSAAQSDLRCEYAADLFCLDASPGAGLCALLRSDLNLPQSYGVDRNSEATTPGWPVLSPASLLSTVSSIQVKHVWSRSPHDPSAQLYPQVFFRPKALAGRHFVDCIEIFASAGNWGLCHEEVGLRVHWGTHVSRGPKHGIFDAAAARELVSLAARRIVREWHAAVPCTSFGSLRQPRVRSRAAPAGFSRALHCKTQIARCTALIPVAVQGQTGVPRSALAFSSCFKVLAGLHVEILLRTQSSAGRRHSGTLLSLSLGSVVVLALSRRDFCVPARCLGTSPWDVHLRNPKTARFARRQHARKPLPPKTIRPRTKPPTPPNTPPPQPRHTLTIPKPSSQTRLGPISPKTLNPSQKTHPLPPQGAGYQLPCDHKLPWNTKLPETPESQKMHSVAA